MTRKYRRENDKNSKKEDKKAKVKKSNKSRLNSLCYFKTNSCEMACRFLQSHDPTRWGTSYFKWLDHWADHKCTKKWRSLFGTIGPVCWYWPTSKRAICFEQDDGNMLQIKEGLIQHLSSEDEKDSCDSEWEIEDGNAFEVIAQELWFVIFLDFLQTYFQTTLFIFSISFFSLYKVVLD